ncbi:hypothetical protein NMG60_11024143 [Bertholletia excelsa]
MASRGDDYRFLQIVDARAAINQRVNLIGVIIETSIPRHSKGTDCFCTIKVVDESYSKPGISINFFAEDMEKLPQVESAGDIILVSHVVMKTHGPEVYGLYNKKFSSFALYEGKYSTNNSPYQVSPKFRPRDQDKKFITGLRKWLEDEMQNSLPLLLEPFALSRDILCTFPTVGTVLRVIGDQGCEKLGIHLKSGRWVKFVNVICERHAGLWRGLLLPSTKLRYFHNDDPIILQSQRYYDERLASKWARMPLISFPWHSRVTETDYEDVPFVTLMDVLTYPEVTAKFRCVVRVIAAFPWRAEDFRSSLGTYRIRLTLEDPTARIHAFIYAEDGEELFGGYPAVDVLTRKRNILLGINENDDNRNPPWVECCLKSYYINKSDAWGSRNYRIFATRIV